MSTTAPALRYLRGDRTIWFIFFALVIFSVLSVYSSTGLLAYKLHGGNTEYLLLKHTGLLAVGLGVAYLAYRVDYKRFGLLAPWMLVLSIVLLVLTLLFGIEINDARRWLQLPVIGVRFQPSDFAKIGIIVYLARAISATQDRISDGKKVFAPVILPVIVVCGLIAPSDLSTSLMLLLTCWVMLFIGRLPMKYLAGFVAAGLVMFALLVFIGTVFPEAVRLGTWTSRLQEFFGGEGGYQVQQAKIAIANGEFLGEGMGKSVQRNYLPTPYADFIYAIICEEYGLLGAGLVIALFLWLFLRTCRLLTKSTKVFGALMACGLSLLLVMQALANIAVAVNLFPVTGLPLPIVSLGGTSLVFSCLAFGIILSVSRYVEATGRLKRGRAAVTAEAA